VPRPASRHRGPLKMILWAALVLVSAPLTDLVLAFWPGGPGAGALEQAYREEEALLASLGTPATARTLAAVRDGLHQALWVWTGLDTLVEDAAAAAAGGIEGIAAHLVLAAAPVWETLYWGVLLRGLRLGVLVACLPLLAAVTLAAAADGLAAWWLRRAGAVRESGFIYHRAKLGLRLSLAALWLAYLLPPVALDPRLIVPPFLVLYGLSLRLALTWFKKHL